MRNALRKYVQHTNAKSSRRATAVAAVGIAMAAAAIFVRQRTRTAERTNPPMGTFIEVDGVRLHYVERGEGQPLVLLHGLLGSSRNWQTAGAELAGRHHVLAVDLRNHGASPHARRP